MIIFYSSFRALGLLLGGLLLVGATLKGGDTSVLPGIVALLVGAALVAVGRYLTRPVLNPATGVLKRSRHSVMFIPLWVWGIVLCIAAVLLWGNMESIPTAYDAG